MTEMKLFTRQKENHRKQTAVELDLGKITLKEWEGMGKIAQVFLTMVPL